jgi:hypothetical protein
MNLKTKLILLIAMISVPVVNMLPMMSNMYPIKIFISLTALVALFVSLRNSGVFGKRTNSEK